MKILSKTLSIGDFVHEMRRSSDISFKLLSIKEYVEKILEIPSSLGSIFGDVHLDELCAEIGTHRKLDLNLSFQKNPIKNVVWIASHLEMSGGHSIALFQLINSYPKGFNHVILVSDIYNKTDLNQVNSRNTSNIDVDICPDKNYPNKLDWLLRRIEEISPTAIWLFNHPQDSVAVSASSAWANEISVYFYHHADHNFCLGVFLTGFVHVDPHNLGYFNCKKQLGLVSNCYIPLTVGDNNELSRKSQNKKSDSAFFTASSGSWSKFKRSYFYDYFEIVIIRLRTLKGEHYHFGEIPQESLALIKELLIKNDLDPERFKYVGLVKSLSENLVEKHIDLYITSFPIGGGLASLECLSSGIPMLLHSSHVSRFCSGCDLLYNGVMTWHDVADFELILSSLSQDLLKKHASLGLKFYRKFYSKKIQEESLFRLVINGDRQPRNIPRLHQFTFNMIDKLMVNNFESIDLVNKNRLLIETNERLHFSRLELERLLSEKALEFNKISVLTNRIISLMKNRLMNFFK